MDINIPPLLTVLGGVAVVGLCFALRIPIFLLGLLSLILLAYTIVLNRNMFQMEYENMTFMRSLAALVNSAPTSGLASILIITVVIILALGYIIYLFGLTSLLTNAPMQIPSFSGSSASLSTPQSQSRNITSNSYLSAFNRAI